MKRVPHAIRKYLSIALLFVLFTALFGCSVKRNDLIPDKEISRIKVQIYPFGETYTFTDHTSVNKIAKYFSGLNLTSGFDEDPLVGNGKIWVVDFYFSDDTMVKIFHSQTVYVKTKDSKWFKTSYEEGMEFERLINEIKENGVAADLP
ncbi:MAG: hypothetical protein J5830_03035 [Clostridia bacterium]|nr:hypothetical protein [Clostridia bacterium]